MTPKDVARFRADVFRRYRTHGRHRLPWRRTHDPYRVFVSEVMLQQTQVSRVLPKYRAWLRAFPNWRALSRAPFVRVLRAWRGLGYNRRARFLKESARVIVERFRGITPRRPSDLEALPGIGRSTARAISCFAFGRCEPFLETNIRRAIIHAWFGRERKRISDAEILSVLARLEPRQNTRDWYLALMDYGNFLAREKENPNRRARSYVRQSRFEGSRRYARAAVVRLLVHARALTEPNIRQALSRDPFVRPHLRPAALRRILGSLEKDRILMYNNNQWAVPRS